MRAMLEEAGFEIVSFDAAADVYVINTCSVTNIADRKSRQMIHRARKMNPSAVVVAAGCYVQTALDRTGKTVDADIIIGSSRKGRLLEELEKYYAEREKERAEDKAAGSVGDVMHEDRFEEMSLPRIEGHTRAYIKVQDGCNMFCSYCIIPFARGRIRSRGMQEILRELEGLAESGVREVVLTGIHLSSYGVDFAGDVTQAYGEEGEKKTWQSRSKLIDLIEAVSQVEGIERIRLGSLEPTIITEEFVRRLSALEKVCPHFHLSLQSGCDTVLKRMNRHYTVADIESIIARLRSFYHRPALTADIIVGFPGETEEEFLTTCRTVERIDLYEAHVFPFSRRKGTVADRMEGQLTEAIKKDRVRRLMELVLRQKAAYYASFESEPQNVLIEEIVDTPSGKCYRGHTERYLLVDIPCSQLGEKEPKEERINTFLEIQKK